VTDAKGTVIVIPARAGSIRLPQKNVLPLAGKPLLCWTIDVALEAGVAERIVVSSDDPKVFRILGSYPTEVVGLRRAPELASATASSVDVVKDVVTRETKAGFPAHTVILLQPTSPLRTSADVKSALNIFRASRGPSVVSVCAVDHPVAWSGPINERGHFCAQGLQAKNQSLESRQDYRVNGAVYVASTETLWSLDSLFSDVLLPYVMPRERSVDIDEPFDLTVCRALLKDRLSGNETSGQ
jgi:N-acylneuraminate cytidylyltransferase/CMP-N,N'-diacetyllegionaminic acid synthase